MKCPFEMAAPAALHCFRVRRPWLYYPHFTTFRNEIFDGIFVQIKILVKRRKVHCEIDRKIVVIALLFMLSLPWIHGLEIKQNFLVEHTIQTPQLVKSWSEIFDGSVTDLFSKHYGLCPCMDNFRYVIHDSFTTQFALCGLSHSPQNTFFTWS
jgi:hypothetical protein